ncbi:MAG: hypothetical protein JW808_07995, partial [Victivallales bacterium]|nr:hypothetical protein [Victivallales bacterium]
MSNHKPKSPRISPPDPSSSMLIEGMDREQRDAVDFYRARSCPWRGFYPSPIFGKMEKYSCAWGLLALPR